jgi:hypothetical protein
MVDKEPKVISDAVGEEDPEGDCGWTETRASVFFVIRSNTVSHAQ